MTYRQWNIVENYPNLKVIVCVFTSVLYSLTKELVIKFFYKISKVIKLLAETLPSKYTVYTAWEVKTVGTTEFYFWVNLLHVHVHHSSVFCRRAWGSIFSMVLYYLVIISPNIVIISNMVIVSCLYNACKVYF